MDYFVNLRTVFEDITDRKIERLKLLYANKSFLISIIEGIIESKLRHESIKNRRVLLKPNWVLHNRKETDEICMRTDDNFLLAALEVILAKKPAQVTIGDAPIQGADWDQIIREPFKEAIAALSKNYQTPILIKDFRRVTFDPASNNLIKERNPLSEYLVFDLGKDSFLEPISYNDRKLFRVTDYDPNRLAESHSLGIHKYCITKELFENDVVITLPKVKTHQKTGITNALKILVGVNGDKDFLPHHRRGGTGSGGDCYPGNNILRNWAELSLDQANRHRGESQYHNWIKLTNLLWRLSFPNNEHSLEAAWYGNDTTWRMVLDLNKIAEYGKADGTISNIVQREIYSLSDGIIGGQGNGPLRPEPLSLGVVCFSNHSGMTDNVMGTLMGFDIIKIPLLKFASAQSNDNKIEIFLNDRQIELEEIKKYSIKTIPPPGWVNYLS